MMVIVPREICIQWKKKSDKISRSRPFSSEEDHKKEQVYDDPFAFKSTFAHMETSECLI